MGANITQQPSFAQALAHTIDLTSQLEKLLLEETGSLDGRDPDHLQTLVTTKQRVLEQIETATATLRQRIEEAGQAFTPDGVETFLHASEPAPGRQDALRADWKRLRELAASCELMNRTNAQAVERGRERVDTALKIIRGEEDNGNTYSARGYARPNIVLGRTLTQA